MDRLAAYSQIIKSELAERANIVNTDFPSIRFRLIYNECQTDFILIRFGWHDHYYRHHVVFHLEIIENQVWIHQNNTDVPLRQILVEKGIPESSIVLGFLSELERTFDEPLTVES